MLRILGFDPGTVKAGWAIVDLDLACTQYGLWKAPKPRAAIEDRLGDQLAYMDSLFGRFLAGAYTDSEFHAVAVESQFVGKNAKAALRLSEGKGVILALAGKYGVPVVEVPPGLVKRSVTGHGHAGKEAVARMITGMLDIREEIKSDDVTDAMAIAYTVANRFKRTERILRAVKLWIEDFEGEKQAAIVRKAWKKIKQLRI